MKIGISGASGTGKTRLAEWIAENYKIENVNLSGKVLWPELGINTHEELIIKSHTNPDWGAQYQGDLLTHRIMELDKRVNSYVTDRTPIDNIVYMLLQSSMYLSDEDTNNFIVNAVKHTMQYYTHIIIIPITHRNVENDNKRVTNFDYQLMVDGIYKRVMEMYVLPEFAKTKHQPKMIVLSDWDWETRKKQVREFASPFQI